MERMIQAMSVNRVIKLRSFLENLLSSLDSNVFYEDASKDAKYPYLVYNLEDSFDDGSIESFPLIIDGWDNNNDTTNLENLMSKVDNSLHRLTGGDEELFFIFYRSSRRTVRDPDKRLKRRQIEFEVKVMGGNR